MALGAAALGVGVLAVWLVLGARPGLPLAAPPSDPSDIPLTEHESPAPPPPAPPAAPGKTVPPAPPTRPATAADGSAPPLRPAPAPRPEGLRDRFDDVDAALGELVRGHVAFNTPERMQYRERRTVTLFASPQMDAATLSEELRERIGSGEAVQVEALQVAPLMEAHLEGAPAFEVTALTPGRQPVSRSTPTEWRWDVRASETGTQTLHLTMNAVVTIDGERFPRSLGVLDRDIEVEITATQQVGLFVARNWQWLAGTIVVPLTVWLWSHRNSRRRRGRGAAPQPG